MKLAALFSITIVCVLSQTDDNLGTILPTTISELVNSTAERLADVNGLLSTINTFGAEEIAVLQTDLNEFVAKIYKDLANIQKQADSLGNNRDHCLKGASVDEMKAVLASGVNKCMESVRNSGKALLNEGVVNLQQISDATKKLQAADCRTSVACVVSNLAQANSLKFNLHDIESKEMELMLMGGNEVNRCTKEALSDFNNRTSSIVRCLLG